MKKINILSILILSIVILLSGCSKSKIVDNKNVTIPENCISWFDWCNNCFVENGTMGWCTRMACEKIQEPKCNEFKK